MSSPSVPSSAASSLRGLLSRLESRPQAALVAAGAAAVVAAAVWWWRQNRTVKEPILPCRPLHWVFKVGDLQKSVDFYQHVLGLSIQRHEEFDKGCEATCNGPYSGWWSKTMMSITSEEDFSLELTYNYGVDTYQLGNDLAGIHVAVQGAARRAREKGIPLLPTQEKGVVKVQNPDGQWFFLHDEPAPEGHDPFLYVSLNTADLKRATDYYVNLLGMNVYQRGSNSVIVGYAPNRTKLQLIQVSHPIDHGASFGRIAFASHEVLRTFERVRAAGDTVLNEPVSLSTEGKANVTVTILADRDGYEICMVDDGDFRELCKRKPGDEVINWQARSKRIAAQTRFANSFDRH